FDIRIAYQDEVDKKGELEQWKPELVVDFWWNGKMHRRFTHVLKQVSSHRWAQQKWGKLTPQQLMRSHCARVVGVAVPSRRLAGLLSSASTAIRVHHAPKGYDPAVIEDYGLRRAGELVIG